MTTSFNNNEKPVWASYSQFQQAVTTRKNQFELVTASFNDKEKPVWASYRTVLCHAQQPVSTTRKNQFELVTASFNDKKNQFELVTASFNNQEKPVWASQFQQPGRTSLS